MSDRERLTAMQAEFARKHQEFVDAHDRNDPPAARQKAKELAQTESEGRRQLGGTWRPRS
jgi:hypothetical protein